MTSHRKRLHGVLACVVLAQALACGTQSDAAVATPSVCSQEFDAAFARRFGAGDEGDAYDVSVAHDGSIYLAGTGVLDLPRCGAGPAFGQGSAFVARLDGSGRVLWERRVEVYPTDSRRARIDARHGPGVTFALEVEDSSDLGLGPVQRGVALGRFDENGQPTFVRALPGLRAPFSMGTAADGSAVLAAGCTGALVVEGAELCRDHQGAFVARIDASGMLIAWRTLRREPGGRAIFPGTWSGAVAVAPAGEIIVAGTLSGAVDLGAGVVAKPATQSAAFIARYDQDLELATHIVVPAQFGAIQLDVSPDDGHVVLAATYSGNADFGGGPLALGLTNLVIARFDQQLAHVYSRGFASNFPAWPDSASVDPEGNALLTARLGAGTNLDGVLVSRTGPVFFELDPFGNVRRVEAVGIRSLRTAAAGPDASRVLVGGLSRSDEPFDFGEGPLAVVGRDDGFVWKLAPTSP